MTPDHTPSSPTVGAETIVSPTIDQALIDLQWAYPGAFWVLGYGKTTADEPPYGIRILFGTDEVLAEGEGETAVESILAAIGEATLSEEAIGRVVEHAFDGDDVPATDWEVRAIEAKARIRDAGPDLLEAVQVVRMSRGWQYMSDETKALIEAAISKALSNGEHSRSSPPTDGPKGQDGLEGGGS